MMQVVLPRSWKEEFAAAAARREDTLHKEKLARFNDQERQRRKDEQIEAESDEADMLATIEIVFATDEALAKFRVELDEYDAKTVEALMANREALEAVRKRIDAMLADAHTLPDGRRVFKTEDGLRVFDEHGRELSPETVDPAEINDEKPKWEIFQAEIEEEKRLAEKRQSLLEYQAKLDRVRERLNSGEITQDELEQMKANLAADMPEAVREKLGPGLVKANVVPTQEVPTTVAPEAGLPPDMDALMRQTGLGVVPAGP